MTSKMLLGILVILIAVSVFASPGPRPAFEVASIKLHADARPGDGVAGLFRTYQARHACKSKRRPKNKGSRSRLPQSAF